MAKRKPLVRITREAYNAIMGEATRSRRERIGVVYGRREREGYKISKANRLSPELVS